MFFPRIYGLNLVEEHQTHIEGHPRELKGCTLFIGHERWETKELFHIEEDRGDLITKYSICSWIRC